MQPIRVQRKRTKGFKLPKNTICVTRGTKFVNPFCVNGWFKIGPGAGTNGFAWLRSFVGDTGGFTKIETHQQAVEMYAEYLKRYPLPETKLAILRGKNLACFCKEGATCHADILLKLANP